jgi:hypothetical protein
MLENETEVLDLTVISPVYDIVIADFEEAVVLDMESIWQYCTLLPYCRAWSHPFHGIQARRKEDTSLTALTWKVTKAVQFGKGYIEK